MAKKNFTGGLSALLGDAQPPAQPDEARPSEARPESKPTAPAEEARPAAPAKSTQIGTRAGETRATFIVNESLNEKVKAIAYWDRLQIKDVVGDALSEYVARYERENGPVKPIPTR